MLEELEIATTRSNRTIRLRPGGRLTFGRGACDDGPPVDLVLSNDRRVSGRAGVFEAMPDYWSVQNCNRYLTLRVIDLEGGAYRDLEPREATRCNRAARRETIVNWRAARVVLRLSASESIDLYVTARWSALPVDVGSSRSDGTIRPNTIDKKTMYYVTLLMLCERSLFDASNVVLLSDAQVAARLRETGLDPTANERMVERRLVDARLHLGLGPQQVGAQHVPKSSIRALLVDTAIATGVVTRADLFDRGLRPVDERVPVLL